MSKRDNYAQELNLLKRKLSLNANFGDETHKMQVEEEKFANEIEQLPQSFFDEFSQFEKVELLDYWKQENNGRTDKKR